MERNDRCGQKKKTDLSDAGVGTAALRDAAWTGHGGEPAGRGAGHCAA